MSDAILEIIDGLNNLPEDHEPTTEELWDAIRRIETLVRPVRCVNMAPFPSVKVDATGFQEADTNDGGGTTYYGGEIFVTNDTNVDIQINCSGNDRGDDNVFWPTIEAILRGLKFRNLDHDSDKWDELVGEVQDLETEITAAIRSASEFHVYRSGDKLIVQYENGGLAEACVVPQEGNDN